MNAELASGSVLAGYRVESVLGRGGMGVVYRATDLSLERPVALKVIAPEWASDERLRRRFLKEPRLAASLDHPNVVPIYEAGEHDGALFLAMRYVDGSDLRLVLDGEGRLSADRALAVLAPLAEALDTAHRRGLVHRDVKPANVLIDAVGHVYLTDFGITKQLGGGSTETGQVVGTLDYIAPEQLRGGRIDGRADVYSLGCVLYECLAGDPPFRRDTQIATMWAHMREPPPPLPAHPALEPVVEKALAKDPDERYATASELVEAARAAVSPPAPAGPAARMPAALVRRRLAILLAGLLVTAAAVAAAVVAGGGEDPPLRPVESGVAAIGADGRIGSFTEIATAPSNVAVGEGAVWVLNTEASTISRIDPATGAVVGTFNTGRTPSDIAAGAGALWVGNGGGSVTTGTVSVSRIDPASGRVTRTVKLPDRSGEGGFPSMGFPGIAVGAGAVWAVGPDGVSRIDPRTGRIEETIDVSPFGIAAGPEGVWIIRSDRPSTVVPLDRPGKGIAAGSEQLDGIAVGGGYVWATSALDGLVWRFEPGPRPAARSIDVGVGVTYLAFGAGAVWAANYVDGTVSRIDPRTSRVTARVPVGAPQALAAGEGSAWVSLAGVPTDGTLPASACREIESGGRTPDLLVASDLPLQGPSSAGPRAAAEAIRLIFKQHGYRAGRFTVGHQLCDSSTAQSGSWELRRCAANANAYGRARGLVAVIGPWSSFCAQVQIPILNRAPGGPVAIVSPSNTYPGLTRPESLPAPWGVRGEPDAYYPTGVRNFMRVTARDNLQGTALAMLAARRGARTAYLLTHDRSGFFKGLLLDPFRRAARTLGIRIVGSETYDPTTPSFRQLAERVARSGAQGVVLGGSAFEGGDRLLKALRARLGRRLTIMTTNIFMPVDAVLERAGRAAHGVYVSTTDIPSAARRPLSPAARRFLRDLGALPPAGTAAAFVLESAQAAELVLQAIERSDGTRRSVLHELRSATVDDGLLGSFRFDRNGDITPAQILLLRITGSTPPGEGLDPQFQGAVVERLVEVPARLSE